MDLSNSTGCNGGKMHFPYVAISGLILSMAMPAQAAIVFDGNKPNGVIGDRMDQWYITADDFTLGSAQTLRSISFSAYQYKPSIDTLGPAMDQRSLTYWIIADNGGKPGQVLTQAAAQDLRFTATGQQGYQVEKAGNYPRSTVEFNLAADFAAAAGQKYWLALQFDDPAYIYWETADRRDANDDAYFIATSYNPVTDANLFAPEKKTPGWIRTTGMYGNHAFSLDTARLSGTDGVSAVPEPATWAMVLVGFGMIGAAARYRRRRTMVRFA